MMKAIYGQFEAFNELSGDLTQQKTLNFISTLKEQTSFWIESNALTQQ